MKNRLQSFPLLSGIIILIIVGGCVCADLIAPIDPAYLDVSHYSTPPGSGYIFGTDTLGRDLWSCIWHGGRVSIAIGLVSTAISTLIAVVYGSISGMASETVDTIMMRLTEIILSIPSLLLIIFAQAIMGAASVMSLSIVMGITGWCTIAKVVRMEVRKLRSSEYVLISRAMGGSFAHILRRHLMPNFIASIMFMVIMNIRTAIVAESTLSFMGIGLPLTVISWGSMLSLSQNAMMTHGWWIILIPGLFLIALLVSITSVANWYREKNNRSGSNL